MSSRPSDEGPGATILAVVAFLVLADGLAAGLDRRARGLAAVVAAGGAVLAVLVEPPVRIGGLPDDLAAAVRWAAGLAILIPPVVLTLRGSRTGARPVVVDRPPWEAGVDEIPLVIAALTPPATLLAWGLDRGSQSLALSLIWLTIAVAILGTRTRVRTFRLQRDLVVTATEAERRRLAADLHDDALQEMAVLVRRLDSAGFSEAAETARAIAERLREVCGELRLPILDDLGAGSAIAWLVDRVERASIDRIELERSESGRPPPPVELAVFRVAQEALSNAVTHGGGPITVRYAAGPDLVHLSVLDSGSGLTREAAVAARRSGHFGLLTMRQRAEQIGASLEIRGGPEGGTQVALEWRST